MTLRRSPTWPRLIALAAVSAAVLPAGCRQADLPASDDEPNATPASPAHAAAEAASAPAAIPSALPPPAAKPESALPPGTDCTTAECHADFQSARHIHGPISQGDCASCHAEDVGGHQYPLKREASALCTFCHAVEGRRAHPHRAMVQGGCLPCHRPHVSESKFLLAAESIEALCNNCHPMEHGRYAHGPFRAGECTACHEPHESNSEDLLRGGNGPQHCFMCHAETQQALANAPHVHSPAAENCGTCHSPHSSDFPHHLKAPVEQLCFGCHQDIEPQVRGVHAPHAAVFTAEHCANCHDPHAAGRPGLLRDRLDRLCLKCHDKPIAATGGRTIPDMRPVLTGKKSLHGPVESGDCSACHNAHGSAESRLLREKFPSGFYTSFDLANYALCFQCHNPALVLEEKTTALTGFRNGDVNLHYLHVHREQKGRTCKACHAIHGSDLPEHMASEVPFEGSQWAMPIQFNKTAGGGSCAPGCHQPETYERDKDRGLPASKPTRGAP